MQKIALEEEGYYFKKRKQTQTNKPKTRPKKTQRPLIQFRGKDYPRLGRRSARTVVVVVVGGV